MDKTFDCIIYSPMSPPWLTLQLIVERTKQGVQSPPHNGTSAKVFVKKDHCSKIRINIIIFRIKKLLSTCKKWLWVLNGLSSTDYKVASLSKSYWNHHPNYEINRTILTGLILKVVIYDEVKSKV